MDFDAVAFLLRGFRRHENPALDAHGAAGISHALRVVSGRRRHDSGFALFLAEFRDGIVGAPDFIGAHILQVLAFQKHLSAGFLR